MYSTDPVYLCMYPDVWEFKGTTRMFTHLKYIWLPKCEALEMSFIHGSSESSCEMTYHYMIATMRWQRGLHTSTGNIMNIITWQQRGSHCQWPCGMWQSWAKSSISIGPTQCKYCWNRTQVAWRYDATWCNIGSSAVLWTRLKNTVPTAAMYVGIDWHVWAVLSYHQKWLIISLPNPVWSVLVHRDDWREGHRRERERGREGEREGERRSTCVCVTLFW